MYLLVIVSAGELLIQLLWETHRNGNVKLERQGLNGIYYEGVQMEL